MLFGISAWIAVNGMFVELPLLVQTQPEGWNLPSYLAIIVQLANLGPILYSVSQKFLPGKIRDSTIIYVILIIGTISLLLMSFLYKETTLVGGVEHSTSLFVLSFFVALVGCTSSVLFMPFMRNFKEMYLTSYFVGEGLSGFIPSIVALIQGVGGNPTCVNSTIVDGTGESVNVTLVPYTPPPNFSSQAFFIFLFAMLVLSTLSFFLLNNLQVCKEEKVDSVQKIGNGAQIKSAKAPDDKDERIAQESESEGYIRPKSNNNETQDIFTVTTTCQQAAKADEGTHLKRRTFASLLVLAAWLCVFGNGVFPSIQSYSCLPYGNIAYHLSATLSSMANPLACFLGFFVATTSLRSISLLSGLCTVFAVYIAVTAVMSPTPPLVGLAGGEALVVLAWILFTGLISYIKLSIASVLRKEKKDRALFWCGAVQQMGSAVGAIFIFFLVNFSDVFHAYYPCQ